LRLNTETTLLFVTPSAYPLGGVAVWLQYIVNGLENKGWQCWVGLVDGKFHCTERYLSEYSFENTIKITNVTNTRYGRVKAIEKAIRHVSADIVVSINIPDVFEAVTRLKQRQPSIKAVMTLHGLEPDYFKDIAHFKRQIDAVVVTNQLTKSMVVHQSGFEEERVIYAPYGVDMPRELDCRAKSSPIVLAYVGRITSNQKRCRDLVGLIEQLEKKQTAYQLKLVGDGDERESLIIELNKIAKLGDVVYVGVVTNQQMVKEVFPSIDMLVLTSDWETGPIVIWEAMAAGVVVLSSKYIGSGIENALTNGENCLLFNIGDMESAAQHIKEFVESDNSNKYRNKLRSNGFELVKKKYSREASILKWNEAFSSIHQNVSTKPNASKIASWPIRSVVERLFGHKIDYLFRRFSGKHAFIDNAGDEWPHSYGKVTEHDKLGFHKLRIELDDRSRPL